MNVLEFLALVLALSWLVMRVIDQFRGGSVLFRDLAVGQEFECYGNECLNYSFPKICKCIKIDEHTGQEIDGINFSMNGSELVSVKGK